MEERLLGLSLKECYIFERELEKNKQQQQQQQQQQKFFTYQNILLELQENSALPCVCVHSSFFIPGLAV